MPTAKKTEKDYPPHSFKTTTKSVHLFWNYDAIARK